MPVTFIPAAGPAVPNRLSDIQIATRVVPTSLRWPDHKTTSWMRLHESVEALRTLLRILDEQCTKAENDRNLSAEGIQRRRTELAQKALAELDNFAPLASAEKTVAQNLVALEKSMNLLPDPPDSIADVMLASQIRAHVASQKSPSEFAMMKAMTDLRVLGALLNAPAFLSGLNEEQQNVIRDRALQTLHPEQVEKQKLLTKALDEVRAGVGAAKRAILERCEMRENPGGQFRLSP